MATFEIASKPYLVVAKVMGIFPLRIVDSHLQTAKASDVLFTSVWFITQIVMFVTMLVVDEVYESSKVLTRIWKILNIFEFSSLFFNFCFQICNRRKVVAFPMKIQSIDDMVKDE
jgi:hypothetical protein